MTLNNRIALAMLLMSLAGFVGHLAGFHLVQFLLSRIAAVLL